MLQRSGCRGDCHGTVTSRASRHSSAVHKSSAQNAKKTLLEQSTKNKAGSEISTTGEEMVPLTVTSFCLQAVGLNKIAFSEQSIG